MTSQRCTLPETNRARRGHQFWPTKAADVPALYSGEFVAMADKVVTAHYFVGGSDWWLTELDPATGVAFGFCAPQGRSTGEWGLVDMVELEAMRPAGWLVVERDCHWHPVAFATLT